MSPVRFAFVGSPRRASPWLLRSLTNLGTLEAICGEDAEQEASRHHARWAFTDVAAMLREAEPEGVVLHRPVGQRAELIKQCLAAGAGVLVLGVPGSPAACKRLTAFSQVCGRRLVALPPIRFAPAVLLGRRLVDSGKAGSPVLMTVRSTWRTEDSVGAEDAGVVPIDQVFAMVTLVNHLLGPVGQVFAKVHPDGALAATLVAGDAVPVSLVCYGRGTADTAGVDVELGGGDGVRLHIDRDLRLICRGGSRVDGLHRTSLAAVDPGVELGYEGLVAEFRRQLALGAAEAGSADPTEALVAAAEAIIASASRGRPITMKPAQALARSGLG